MTQAFTLQPLLDLMQSRTDEATRKLGQLIAAEHSAKSRLEMLEQYREEYAQRLRDAVAGGITQLVLRNYQDFLARIDEAIHAQTIAVTNSAQSTAAGQENWKAQHKRLKAIDTLSLRHDERERHRENKQEQKILDEFSARSYTLRQQEEPEH